MELFTPKLQYSYIIVLVDNSKFSSVRSQYSLKGICLSTTKFCGRGAVFLEWKGEGGQFSSGQLSGHRERKTENTENTMHNLYFNLERVNSEENASDIEGFPSTILHPFQFEPEQKKTCGNESYEKEAKPNQASAADSVRSSRQEVFCKIGVLRNFPKFTGKHLCQSLFCRPQACNFIKNKALAQVFSCEFCEISKNTFSYRTSLVAAFVYYMLQQEIPIGANEDIAKTKREKQIVCCSKKGGCNVYFFD